MRPMEDNRMVSFSLGGMAFEYDDNKNQINIKKHGISFKSAARIFFDIDVMLFLRDQQPLVASALIFVVFPIRQPLPLELSFESHLKFRHS